MTVKLKNNASGTLATAISASDTGVSLSTGNGANFPTLTAPDYFYATLASSGGTTEVVKVTARSGDSLTVVRAQESTTAQSFAAGTRIEMRVTAQSVLDAINGALNYLGPYATDPALRNDGSALQAGDLYFNTTVSELRVYNGSAWQSIVLGGTTVQRFSGNGSATAFVLSTVPATENTISVYVQGVYQQKDTYSVAGSTLNFSEAPVSGTDNIEVVTIQNIAIGTTSAAMVSITDSGGFYSGTDVEAALQQVIQYVPAGTGAVATTVQAKLRESVSVLDFGAVGDGVTDDTAAFALAATYSSSTKVGIYVPPAEYRIRGLDLAGKPYATFIGAPLREYGGSILKTTGTANITADGQTIFVRINSDSPAGSQTRSVGLFNLVLTEDASSLRNRGLVARYAPFTQIKGIQTIGFDRAVRCSYLWNAEIEKLVMYEFRTSGFSMGEGVDTNGNAIQAFSMEASSTLSPAYNYDFRGANSLGCFNLSSEGSCLSHFFVSSTTRSVNIHNVHQEGGQNLLEIDIDAGAPSNPFCDFSIFGGYMALAGTAAGSKFVKTTGTTVNVGLQSLTLNGVWIRKASNLIQTDYFDLSRVAIFNNTSVFEYAATLAVNDLTWINFATSIGRTFVRARTGHNGLTNNQNQALFGTYSGDSRGKTTIRPRSAAQMVSGSIVAYIERATNQPVVLDVDVLISNSAIPANLYFARWVLQISASGVLTVPAAVVTAGTVASATTFTYDDVTKALTATNTMAAGDGAKVTVRQSGYQF